MSVHAIAWAFDQDIPRSSRKFVLVALANFASSECGICFPSTATLSKITSLDRKTVIQCLDDLQSAGYITDTKERRGFTKQVKVYQLEGSQKGNSSKNGTIPFLPPKAPVFPHKGSQKRDTEPSGNSQKPRNPVLFDREIKDRLNLLKDKRSALKLKHCLSHSLNGDTWTPPEKKTEWERLTAKIRSLEEQLA